MPSPQYGKTPQNPPQSRGPNQGNNMPNPRTPADIQNGQRGQRWPSGENYGSQNDWGNNQPNQRRDQQGWSDRSGNQSGQMNNKSENWFSGDGPRGPVKGPRPGQNFQNRGPQSNAGGQPFGGNRMPGPETITPFPNLRQTPASNFPSNGGKIQIYFYL